ncbi:hypothetical protein [Streptomyces sp. NPDC050121]|uniref:hypothetical protein n=1 Tax=Streptomyces sp. NPDC050121 TaxID=3365601 RepID=UPI0037977998
MSGLVEPLLMPEPGQPAHLCASACGQPVEEDVRRFRLAAAGVSYSFRAPADADHLIRYRWIVGHQAAFVVWRLLAHQLKRVVSRPGPAKDAVAAAARLYDVYSLLFLYTASCSAQRYAATVRADMAANHPAFSGEWAPDHHLIPALTRQARAIRPQELVSALDLAARFNQRVHWAIAEKLVPDGVSLLQETGRGPGKAPGPEEAEIYDAFFGVQRYPVCERALSAQAARRAAQVMCDIAQRGLHGPDACRPRFEAAHAAQAERLESQTTELLLDFIMLSQRHQERGTR